MFSKIAIASILFVPITLASVSVQAVSGQCAALEETSYGKIMDADVSAHIYSQNNVGDVGISLYPGVDLRMSGITANQLGLKLVQVLGRAGIQADCFVNNSMFEDSGTAVSFVIDGLSIKIDGDYTFTPKEIIDDKRILATTVAEAKTAKVLLNPK